jgi:hypothetical protein
VTLVAIVALRNMPAAPLQRMLHFASRATAIPY